MPNRDGTGPNGKGPKSGRGFGNCNTNNTKGNSVIRGRGFGRNRGQVKNK